MSTNREWRPVDGFEGLYIVSNQGEIISLPRNGKTGKTLGQVMMPNGYMMASLFKDGSYTSELVHRIVAKAFCPNPLLKTHVNHMNGDRSDNRADNLQWVTPVENEEHKREVLGNRNSPHPSVRRLTDDQALAINRSNKSCIELAKEFGVSKTTIRNIKNGRIYREVTEDVN